MKHDSFKRGFVVVLILSMLCVHALAQSKHPITLDDFSTLKTLDQHMELSPDGNTLAYVTRGELWLVETTPGSEPRKIGSGAMPRWSPDGSSVAYYSNQSGSRQLWLLTLKSGQTTQITNLQGGISPDPRTRFGGWIGDPIRYGWSPDGTKLVFASNVVKQVVSAETSAPEKPSDPNAPLVLTGTTPANWTLSGIIRGTEGNLNRSLPPPSTSQLFVADVATRKVEQLTKDSAGYFNPDWSPDGKRIVCSSAEGKSLSGNDSGNLNIYLVDATTGQATPITNGPGGKRIPFWSPDGKSIGYLADSGFGRLTSISIVSAQGGEPVNVTRKLDRNIFMFWWTADGKSLMVLCLDGVARPIVRIDAATGDFRSITEREAYLGPFSISRNGTMAWGESDGSSEGMVFVQKDAAVKPLVLLNLNPQMESWALGKQEVVRWKNSRGEEIEGILIKPPEYQAGQKYPLIVDPYSSMQNRFIAFPLVGNQGLAARGYVVFLPNHRAPHIWMNIVKNEAYHRVARGPKGWDIMVDDVMSGVDTLIRQGIVDQDRMGLFGFSNGGGTVNYLVTRTDRFKCAVSAAGAESDWGRRFFMNTDAQTARFAGGPTPWEDPEAYIKLSPLYHLDKVTTPMLLAAGDNDTDFLIDTIEMYNGLRYLKRPVTLLRYPNQGHGFNGAAMKDYWTRVNLFFDTYLKQPSSRNSN